MAEPDKVLAWANTLGHQPQHRQPTVKEVLRRKLWVVIAVVVMVFGASATLYPLLPRTYTSTSMVLLQPTDNTGQPIVGRSTINALDENEIQAYDDILSSRPMLEEVIRQLNLLNDPEFNPQLNPPSALSGYKEHIRGWLMMPDMQPLEAVEAALRKHLFIVRSHKSYALQIGFWSSESKKAAAMANALATSFVANRLDNKVGFQNHLTEQLERRYTELAKAYDVSERRTHDYLVQSGLIHRGDRSAMEVQLNSYSTDYAQAESRASRAEDKAKTLNEMQKLGTLDSAPDVLESGIIRDLKERLVLLTSGTGGTTTPANLVELKAQMNAESSRIVRAAQIEALRERAQANVLKAKIADIDTKLVQWQNAERHLETLERETEADRVALKDTMTQLRAQGGIIAALRSDAFIISTAAVSSRPSFPNLIIYVMGTVFLAVLLCAAIVMPALVTATGRPTNLAQSFAHS
jgi:polysaccharide biosynthesis transport protein